MQGRIADVLFYKGTHVYSILPEVTVRAAVDMMARHNVGALVVLSWKRHVVGMFSERDVLWRIVHERRSPDTPVASVMTRDPHTILPDTSVSDAMRLMTERRIRHLPVVDQERTLQGLISIGDLTKWVTRDLENHVGELASYICGGTRVDVQSIL
jgi:CBS domain-containing protein